MPANWYKPSYAEAPLTVGLAKGAIEEFRVPSGAEVGKIIGPATDPIVIGVRNVGSLAGTIYINIRDLDGTAIAGGSKTLAVDEFGLLNLTPAYPMPDRDLRLRAEAYRGAIIDSYMDKTIVLTVEVVTDTTLTLAPASVEPGGIYRYQGRLTRIDTGVGIPSMTIEARRYEAGSWKNVGSTITDANGDYDLSAVAPSTAGTFNCMAVFAGVWPLATSSAQAGLGVIRAVLTPILAVISATLGVALVTLSTWK